MAKVTRYKCNCCGRIHSHKDSYDDAHCYDCVDIDTGKLKEGLSDKEEKVNNG